MDRDSEEPKKFSYPNADRLPDDSGEITGPKRAQDTNLTQEELRQTVHLNDALKEGTVEKPSDMQHIRTFQSDVANAVKTDNVSLIKIALAEKKRQERQGTFNSTLISTSSSKKSIYIGIAVVLILFFAGGFFLYASLRVQTPIEPTDGTTLATPSIEMEKVLDVDIGGKDSNDIERIVQAEKAAELSLGAMERIRFVQTNVAGIAQEVDSAGWLTFMRARAPDSLLRAFERGFVFGVYSLTPHDSFIIFKVESYDIAYAGMLQWEPSMEEDIGGVIINRPERGNTTSTASNNFNGKPFVDRIVNNKDTRVLLDDAGRVKMLYSFIDKNTLVIASGESVLREVVFRLTTGRISR